MPTGAQLDFYRYNTKSMEAIYFVTGSDWKYREAIGVIPDLQRLDLDLPEEQSLDPHFIINQKLKSAEAAHPGLLVVEDTSVYFDGLNGFPGPLIKWLFESLGNDGIYNLCGKLGNFAVTAKSIIGFSDGKHDTRFFEGLSRGSIVSPRGDLSFGWNAIFQPEGFTQTFAEMGLVKKQEISMRAQAFRLLGDYVAARVTN